MSSSALLHDFIQGLPKVELHLHIEGTLEPELWMELARKNNVKTRFSTVEELCKAYSFDSLDSFLDLYYEGMEVLRDESDFYNLTWAYLQKAHAMNVRHLEVMFDPQPHMQRHIAFETVVTGIFRALQRAKTELDLSTVLIMCFVRHLPVEDALDTLQQSLPHKHMIDGVGLDSTEKNKPPEVYRDLFAKARGHGYWCVAHAGEEGPPDYVWGSLQALQARRIDHGIRSVEDPSLVRYLAETKTPLTVCPISNVKLGCFKCVQDHSLVKLLEEGVCVTINSDDPAYFQATIEDNFQVLHTELGFNQEQLVGLVRFSIDACMASDEIKDKIRKELNDYVAEFNSNQTIR